MLRLMIVDDEQQVRRGMRLLLERADLPIESIREASNGLEAVEIARTFSPDLTLLDIKMPILDGLQAAERIREILPQARIVVLTAYADFTYAQQMLRLGAMDYILKPCSADELLEIVRRVIKQKTSAEAAARQNKVSEGGGDTVGASDEDRAMKQIIAGRKLNRQGAILAAKKYVAENCQQPLTLKEVADYLNISPWHLSHIFRQETDLNFREYLLRARIETAKRLLVESHLIVSEVARQVGYSEPGHFTQAFKRIVGMTPRQFAAYTKVARNS